MDGVCGVYGTLDNQGTEFTESSKVLVYVNDVSEENKTLRVFRLS